MSLLDDYGSSSERKVNFLFVKKCFLYGVDKPTNGIRSLCLKLNYIESYNDRNIPSEVDFVCQHSVVSLLLLIYTKTTMYFVQSCACVGSFVIIYIDLL